MIFGDLNLGIDEFFVGMTGPINPAAVFMIQYDGNKGNTREDDQVRNMFEHIADVYMNHISEYEYATERLSFKLTPSEMKKFQEVDGKNNKEKFKNLLNQI